MRILLLGSGGREHALAWKLSQSNRCKHLFIAPGNAGTSQCGSNAALALNDFDGIADFCTKEMIDMVIVGPEEPLVNGIVDFLRSNMNLSGLMIIGPSREGAQLEGSKAYAKAFMHRNGIPTAEYREFDEAHYEQGLEYLRQHPLPVVLKADGLAAGKGVLICQSTDDAVSEFEQMLTKSKFGKAGNKVVVEAFLSGIELSVFVLTDGKNYVVFPEAKDYKRIGEGDTGLNTGGMGAVSPVPFADDSFMQKVTERIIKPTVNGLIREKIDYVGFLFIGLIKVDDEPFVIEYNCRLGDPETEVIIPRLKNDLVDVFVAAAGQHLDGIYVETDERVVSTIVAVSGGYPETFLKGYPISGLDTKQSADSIVFQAATLQHDGSVITNGGRVLCVSSFGYTIPEAVSRSNKVLETIYFQDIFYRKDIGYEFQ